LEEDEHEDCQKRIAELEGEVARLKGELNTVTKQRDRAGEEAETLTARLCEARGQPDHVAEALRSRAALAPDGS